MALGVGAAIGAAAAGAAISGGIAHFSGKSLQSDQQAFNERAYRNRFQWSMEDMRKAGLNPILAANMGLGGTSSATSGIPSTNAGTSAVQGARIAAELRLLEAQERKTGAEADILGPKAKMYEWGLQLIEGLADKYGIPISEAGEKLGLPNELTTAAEAAKETKTPKRNSTKRNLQQLDERRQGYLNRATTNRKRRVNQRRSPPRSGRNTRQGIRGHRP